MSCPSGKRSYRNRAQAVEALLKCRFKRNGKLKRSPNRRERGVYRCWLCDRWHATSQSGATVDLQIDDVA
jgi:hypothetical protein